MSGYSGQVISDKPVSPPEEIPAERVQELIHSVTVRITQQVAQINLQIGEHPPPQGRFMCGVYHHRGDLPCAAGPLR